ncbi:MULTISPECIES: NAD(P)H-dependent flavin oxidoreductase [unclassified Polynucleobacter]|uniref:NAD(P)H-dependent flavin oxidoreductase n=1 Tax=unclassified Polynucleobacter TaxID=2640945 RepID=UPI0025739287|nr:MULTISPECIES: nitronate monooxygenase [unclassified Polynucleobacter]BEI43600.1 nitronate monooxygenase [Polynucleobacter sp. HIN10]BEI45374.1 nitronate monooxygenase [Polynucleobacter sp. HIN11]
MFSFANLSIPVIQAPMAGGITTPALVSEVSNAGGLGSFGFAYSSPETIGHDLKLAQSLTQGPINANFFIFPSAELPDSKTIGQVIELLQELTPDIDFVVPKPPFFPDLETQLEPVWQLQPAVLSFHFGIPPEWLMQRAMALSIAIGITATSLEEALKIEQAGASFIVAQGIEAGGHRGTFEIDSPDERLSTFDLLHQLVKRCTIPVVAAGGMMNGRDIRKALDLGASAVQMGSAFLCCPESGASSEYKALLLDENPRPSIFTKGFSGRWARGVENTFTRHMDAKSTLPFPIQNTLTGQLRQAAARSHNAEHQSLWAGSAFYKARTLTVGELMKALQIEFVS